MLNAQQILEENLLKLENTHGKPAQNSYDLSLKAVNKVGGQFVYGKIFKDKTELTTYTPVYPIKGEGGIEGWFLEPGTYDITFHEGCKIPNNRVAFIKNRSSLWRNGVLITSPLFDSGFETENMGTIMLVTLPIFIECGARVAAIYFHECTPVANEDLYNGQFMFDSQRQNQ